MTYGPVLPSAPGWLRRGSEPRHGPGGWQEVPLLLFARLLTVLREAVTRKALMTCAVSRFFRQNHIYSILFSLFFWKKKYFHPKCFNSALRLWLKAHLVSLNAIYFMVFRKTNCWLQHEGTTNLDSTVIKTGWKNFPSHSGQRFGLTCTVRWSSASGKGSEPREPSHPGNSAFSWCSKVGGWTCVPVFETAGSRNPLQGRSARLRTEGRLAVSLVGSRLVSSPARQAEGRSFLATWTMADPLKHRAQSAGVPLLPPESWQNWSFFSLLLNPCWRLSSITTTPFSW